jgi:hypothetical protein
MGLVSEGKAGKEAQARTEGHNTKAQNGALKRQTKWSNSEMPFTCRARCGYMVEEDRWQERCQGQGQGQR